ncbi:receptor-type tyrosine-protein phosphatase N2-like [Brachionichthys hirsutus]|uniref:receptor-type tyrosine-protein phosphatase N2-like n=1 Tax=Brachionichthys hirsutus TaxID=412623 RepID=UPI0036047D60
MDPRSFLLLLLLLLLASADRRFGLTWEGGSSQRVLSMELNKLRRLPARPPQSGPVYPESRSGASQVDPADPRVKPVEAELSRSLRTYLRRLGVSPPITAGRPPSDRYRSKAQPPSSFPVPVQKQRPPTDRLPASQVDGDLLLVALRRYLSLGVNLGQLRPLYRNGIESSGLKKETSKPRRVKMDPLTSVDERFIQTVLKNAWRRHVNVDNLTSQDLDRLSRFIADALQVVDQDQGPNGGLSRVRPGPRDLKPQETTGAPAQLQERRTDSPEVQVKDESESGILFSKLLHYLDKTSMDAASLDTPTGEQVGLEDVQSWTGQAGAEVQKKDATKSVEAESAVEGWIKEVVPPPALLVNKEAHKKTMHVPELQLDIKAGRNDVFGYVITDTDGLQTDEGLHLMEVLASKARIQMTDFAELSVVGPAVTFKVNPNPQNVSTADVANVAVQQKTSLEKETKLSILEAGLADGSQIDQIPTKYSRAESTKFLVLTVASLLCIAGVLLASSALYCLRHRSHHKIKEKLTNLGADTSSDATATYQELCRQRMAVKPPSERPEPIGVSSQFSDGGPAVSPSARSSTSSWSEEPAHSAMDISTGHMILSYMEDHLKKKDRLQREWEALCAYQAEPSARTVAMKDGNARKNRSTAVVAYDHCRITLKVENSQGSSDYINASPIMDHDPRNPAYIATQGPLPSTVADFWQMVWENGCVVIVMVTPLVEGGVKQCYHYWPDEGSNLYHIYEVNLVSEHTWCEDFLVRSFYLKNMQTNETRTVTQFHFLTWLNRNVPESSRTLLDFRRKVNKCYRGRSCPVIVHCSDGAGRSGTYILIDMVLNKMAKGAKEIDIAATLEHLRDQRPGVVQTKDQFEFALTAVAEEVNAILKALPQ